MSDREKTFTEALANLQKAVGEIGKQSTTLEESIRLFEIGMAEAEFCNSVLDEAMQKIEVYEKNGEYDA